MEEGIGADCDNCNYQYYNNNNQYGVGFFSLCFLLRRYTFASTAITAIVCVDEAAALTFFSRETNVAFEIALACGRWE